MHRPHKGSALLYHALQSDVRLREPAVSETMATELIVLSPIRAFCKTPKLVEFPYEL